MGTGSSGQVLSMQGHVGTAGNRIHAPGTVLNDKFGSADLGATIFPRFRAEIPVIRARGIIDTAAFRPVGALSKRKARAVFRNAI